MGKEAGLELAADPSFIDYGSYPTLTSYVVAYITASPSCPDPFFACVNGNRVSVGFRDFCVTNCSSDVDDDDEVELRVLGCRLTY